MVEAGHPSATFASTTPDKPAKEVELSGVTETDKGPNQEAPQDAAKPLADAQALHAEGIAFLVVPLQALPPGESFEDPEAASNQPPKGGMKIKLKK